MAETTDTLSAAVTATQLILPVTTGTAAAFAAGNFLRIDNEYMVVVSQSSKNITVRSRGAFGSQAVAHNILALVTTGLTSDLPDQPMGQAVPAYPAFFDAVVAVGVDSTLAPTVNTLYILQKASAAAITLSPPDKSQDGLVIGFLSGTAAAHTITYTAGFYANTTSSDVGTFAAVAGASMMAVAYGGKWGALALTNVTLG